VQSGPGGREPHSSELVEIPFAMSTVVVTPCFANANAVAICYRQPLQKQQCPRGLCLGRTSPQLLSISAIPLWGSQLGLRRGFSRGSKLTQRRSQGPRADSETEERPSRADGNGRAVGGLEELDNQLRVLSSSDNRLSAPKDASKGNEEKPPREEYKKVDWPVFGDGFVLYISVGLILLTIINNVLFRIFLGPPVPRDPPRTRSQDTGVPQVSPERLQRYKLRSSSDPKYFENAPSVTDVPPVNKVEQPIVGK